MNVYYVTSTPAPLLVVLPHLWDPGKVTDTNSKFQDYLKNPNEHSIFMKEIDFGEVYDILRKLDTTKSGDIYGITPKLLSLGAEVHWR